MLSQFNGPKRPAPYSTGHMLGEKKTQQQQQCMCLLSLHAHGYHMADMRYTPTLGCLGYHSAFFLSLPIPPQSAMPSALCARTKDFPCVTGQAIFARQLSHHLDINGDKCDLAGDYAFLFHFRSNLIQFLPPNAGIKKDQEVGRVDEVLLSYI